MTKPAPLATAPFETPGHDLLKGKKVVVTAAAGTGIGYASAHRALLEGADVLVSDWHERRLRETQEKLAAEFPGQAVEALTCDVSSTEQVDALIAGAADALGRIDVLVNNAGLGGETPLVDMTDEEWDRVLDITLNGTFRATRAALRYFKGVEHNGVLVNNASVLGWRAQHSQAHYAAAKAGVMASLGAARSRPPNTGSGSTPSHRPSRGTPSSPRSPARNSSTNWHPTSLRPRR